MTNVISVRILKDFQISRCLLIETYSMEGHKENFHICLTFRMVNIRVMNLQLYGMDPLTSRKGVCD